jgi:hypothetical protein
LNPFFAVYAFFMRTEMFMLLTLLAGFYMLIVGLEEKKTSFLLASGILLALAVLFKEFALVGTAVALAYTLWQWRLTPKKGITAAMMVGIPSVMALAGWAAWSWELSPVTFAATMKRWLDSAASSASLEPRMGLPWTAWGLQVGSRLLGVGLLIGLLVALAQYVLGRGRKPYLGLLWAYMLFTVGLSFFISLKEPRHLIAILPAAALLTGHALAKIWGNGGIRFRMLSRGTSAITRSQVKPVAALVVIGIVIAFAGPLRPPLLPRPADDRLPWVAAVYAERLANDDFYGVLAMAGKQVRAMTAPGEAITVVHQAPVVAFYADRPYAMLYTMPSAAVNDRLNRATVLVWDAPTFVMLTGEEIGRVQASLAADFMLEKVVTDDQRSVAIYRRKVAHD